LGSLFQQEIDSLDELNSQLENVELTQEEIQVQLDKPANFIYIYI
jgi:hypothetical protein